MDGSKCDPGTKRMHPLSTVASVTASQHVTVDASCVKGGQYARSWCQANTASVLCGRFASICRGHGER